MKTKIVIILLLASLVSISFPKPTRAGWWGEPMMAVEYQITVEKMLKSIQDTIIANLKMAAIRIIQARLTSLLGSVGGSTDGVAGAIISDWKAFIYTSASKYSTYVTNSFFTTLESSATSATKKYILTPAKNALVADSEIKQPNLQDYLSSGDPTKIFSSGTNKDWKIWNVASQPQNDLASTYSKAASLKQVAELQQAEAKKAEGVAGQGNKSIDNSKTTEATTSTGSKVTVPSGSDYKGAQSISVAGSMIGFLKGEANAMPMRMLTLARSIPEVATAMVNQMIAQVIQQGAEKLATGSSSSSSLSSSLTSQMQSSIESGVRKAASPTTFFGN